MIACELHQAPSSFERLWVARSSEPIPVNVCEPSRKNEGVIEKKIYEARNIVLEVFLRETTNPHQVIFLNHAENKKSMAGYGPVFPYR